MLGLTCFVIGSGMSLLVGASLQSHADNNPNSTCGKLDKGLNKMLNSASECKKIAKD